MSETRVDATGDCLTEVTGDLISQSDSKSNCGSADRAPSNINSVVICQAVRRSIFSSSTSSAAERVSLILKQEENEEASCPILFIQLSELFSTAERQEWRQTAR